MTVASLICNSYQRVASNSFLKYTRKLETTETSSQFQRYNTSIRPAHVILVVASKMFQYARGSTKLYYSSLGFFPDLPPSTRQFNTPVYPSSVVRTMNNRAARYLMASKPGQGSISLTYDNIPDEQANQFELAYQSCYGSYKVFELPASFFNGIEEDLAKYIDLTDSSLRWRWDSPPKITSVMRSISTVSITLKAYTASTTLVQPGAAPANPYTPTPTIDTTKYPSFSGSVITPPTPPTPQSGKKWVAYSPQPYVINGDQSNIVVDSSGNFYVVRMWDGIIALLKFSNEGSLVWRYRSSTPWDFCTLILVSDNLIIACADYDTAGTTASKTEFVGFTNDGTVLYRRRYSSGGGVLFSSYVYFSNIDRLVVLGGKGSTINSVYLHMYNPLTGLATAGVQLASTALEMTTGLVSSVFQGYEDELIVVGTDYLLKIIVTAASFTVDSCVKYLTTPSETFKFGVKTTDSSGYIISGSKLFLVDRILEPVMIKRLASTPSYISQPLTITPLTENNYLFSTNSDSSALKGNIVAKLNWYTGVMEWATQASYKQNLVFETSSSHGRYTIDIARNRILATCENAGSTIKNPYSYILKSDLQLPNTVNTLTTPSPPGIALSGITVYAPNQNLEIANIDIYTIACTVTTTPFIPPFLSTNTTGFSSEYADYYLTSDL